MLVKKTILIFSLILSAVTLYSQEAGEHVLSLDGEWQILFDPDNEGQQKKWFLNEQFQHQEKIRTITVPSSWETIEEDYEGVAFYRTEFKIPEAWEHRVIRLRFDAVNYICEAWLNDEVVGYHEGGYTPFEFRVDQIISTGTTNTLTLRVIGPLFFSDQVIDGIGRLETPQWRGGISGGVWQTVSIIATGEAYIEDVFLKPDLSEKNVDLEITLDHTSLRGTKAALEMEINAFTGGQQSAVLTKNIQLHPGINTEKFTLEIPEVRYWSPDDPFLYVANVKILLDEEVSDQWSHRFGMRELTIRDKDFYLNGERIYIKASFFEGLYPNKIAFPDSEDMARREITLAKEAGFNMIRPWRHPPPPMWLDLADEMGILVTGSPVLECMTLPLSTPYLPWRVENEIRESVLRDRNRTCVVQWELFNELHRPILKQMMRPMALLTRDLDPSRLILDESGGWAFGANMYLPESYEPIRFNDIHNYPGPFLDRRQYDGYLAVGMTEEEKAANGLEGNVPGRNVVPGLMSFISELGYGSLPDMVSVNKKFQENGNPLTPAYRYHERIDREQREILNESGFDEFYPDIQQFYLDQQYLHGEANQNMIEATRSNPNIDGYCVHALAAGDWILGAGLIDLWRTPKGHAYEATKAANQPRILALRILPRNALVSEGTTLKVTGINDLEETAGVLVVTVRSEQGDAVWEKKINCTLKKGVTLLLEEALITKEMEGHYNVEATLADRDANPLAKGIRSFSVFSEPETPEGEPVVTFVDPGHPAANFLSSKGIEVSNFSKKRPGKELVVASGYNSDSFDRETLEGLWEFVRKGGRVILIDPLEESTIEKDDAHFPFKANVHPARGLWTCIPHMVHEHPIFEGLPAGTMMTEVYENLWAFSTLQDIEGEEITEYIPIVAALGFDWFSADHKLHYRGPGDSWWGSDLALLRIGKGVILVSQLRIGSNLGNDPVAGHLLLNMIDYMNTL